MSSHRPKHCNGAVEATLQDLELKGWTITYSKDEFSLHYPGGSFAGTVSDIMKGSRDQVLAIIHKK